MNAYKLMTAIGPEDFNTKLGEAQTEGWEPFSGHQVAFSTTGPHGPAYVNYSILLFRPIPQP